MTEDNVTPINERARLFASICFCQIHDGPDSTDLDQMEHDFVPPSNLSTNPYRKETEE